MTAEQILRNFRELNNAERAAVFLAIAREESFPQAVRELAAEALQPKPTPAPHRK